MASEGASDFHMLSLPAHQGHGGMEQNGQADGDGHAGTPASVVAAACTTKPAQRQQQEPGHVEDAEPRMISMLAANDTGRPKFRSSRAELSGCGAAVPVTACSYKLEKLRRAMLQVDEQLVKLGATRLEEYIEKYGSSSGAGEDIGEGSGRNGASTATVDQSPNGAAGGSTKKRKAALVDSSRGISTLTPANAQSLGDLEEGELRAQPTAAAAATSASSTAGLVAAGQLAASVPSTSKKRKTKHFHLIATKSYVSQLYEYLQGSAESLVAVEWGSSSYYIGDV
ncbi:hypothetical protein K437DRAFT_48131 [Tilletiaria anomala UBC 951]|uniref:Uncharacterized protein n=1 Tax=Tilletiaria anomala (strain ATCC 24038 / CBS 436.72 / UBC 951) TaxID=1037660 RepID=A0A066VEA5_TILAU|nr:uncharacterized protein K437DRAFT_48131 [Tilletiaria anomala UBC 951]KDN36885.1 hypothetical protein K437DRAFT_48131 [Tilletiaria anomala UBC 951]